MAPTSALGTAAIEQIDQQDFRKALGAFPSGVTVVTTAANGAPYGMTVSSFTSLSLEPLLVLICLANSGRVEEVLRIDSPFTVNVLGSHQVGISRRFADRRRPAGADAFDGIPFHWSETACPVIDGALATVDCHTVARHPGGDHTIVVGSVVGLDVDPAAMPLVFFRGQYRLLGDQGAPAVPDHSPRRLPANVVPFDRSTE